MFKKLVSNLPFNPSLINQVSFYAKRLHQEEALRRIGLVLVALSFLVHLFGVVSPPQPTLAESTNDIIRGGFTTPQDAANKCKDTTKDYSKIFSYYGVTCDMLATAATEYIRSTGENRYFDSLGRNQQGPIITRTQKPTNEYPVNIPGVQTLWMKNLWAWDSGSYSTYKVLKLTNKHGQIIRVLYNCGNVVTVGEYFPPAPAPTPAPAPRPAPTPAPAPTPVTNTAKCASFTATQINKFTYKFRAATSGSNYKVISYTFDFGDGNSKVLTTNALAAAQQHTYVGQGSFTAKVAIKTDVSGSGSQPRTVSCQAPVTIAATTTPVVICKDNSTCVELSKLASNLTQKLNDANNTTAAAGDKIKYELIVKNISGVKVENYIIEENLSDVLDYSDTVDLNGGKIDKNTLVVSWPAVDLKPGQTIKKYISIRVKNQIPNTPVSSSDPGKYDLVMTNVFGNAVNIRLASDVVKSTEQVVQTLPNTGPGEVLLVAFTISLICGYFFARTRIMGKEIEIIKTDYSLGTHS